CCRTLSRCARRASRSPPRPCGPWVSVPRCSTPWPSRTATAASIRKPSRARSRNLAFGVDQSPALACHAVLEALGVAGADAVERRAGAGAPACVAAFGEGVLSAAVAGPGLRALAAAEGGGGRGDQQQDGGGRKPSGQAVPHSRIIPHLGPCRERAV